MRGSRMTIAEIPRSNMRCSSPSLRPAPFGLSNKDSEPPPPLHIHRCQLTIREPPAARKFSKKGRVTDDQDAFFGPRQQIGAKRLDPVDEISHRFLDDNWRFDAIVIFGFPVPPGFVEMVECKPRKILG